MRLRGAAAVVGVGQTPYYKRGQSPYPELQLALQAIVGACEDAGFDPRDVDGFISYASERNDAQKLLPGLGTREVRYSALCWIHGGGIPGAVGIAAQAVATGQANAVVVYRAMAEGSTMRLREMVAQGDTSAQYIVNGLEAPAQILAMRSQRMLQKHGVPASTLKAMAQSAYYHAQRNPRAYGAGIVLDDETYDHARMIAEPFRLFDCSRENDGSCAVLVMRADMAKDTAKPPAYILAAPMGAYGGSGAREENITPYSFAGQTSVARRLWEQSGYGPQDVDVAQVYQNFSGLGVGALIDHGFCSAENAGDFITFDNLIAPTGKLPCNTSGGDLAEGFIHGMGLVAEAVRQLRGESVNQVPDAKLSLMTGGPGDTMTSTGLFGTVDTL